MQVQFFDVINKLPLGNAQATGSLAELLEVADFVTLHVPETPQTRGMIAAAVRAASVPPFHAMAMSREATEREATGARVLHLEVGQPSTPLPALARRAVEDALEHPLGYTNAAGLNRLRTRLAERYAADDQLEIRLSGYDRNYYTHVTMPISVDGLDFNFDRQLSMSSARM